MTWTGDNQSVGVTAEPPPPRAVDKGPWRRPPVTGRAGRKYDLIGMGAVFVIFGPERFDSKEILWFSYRLGMHPRFLHWDFVFFIRDTIEFFSK